MPERQCHTCTARNKVAWGCTTDAKEKAEIDGVKLVRCPKRLFLEAQEEDGGQSLSELFWYYNNYKKGFLPADGGLQDQPGMMMDLFRIIDGAIGTIEAGYRKKAEADRNRPKAGDRSGMRTR